MGKSLRVLDSGSWSTVKVPHILADGVWEKTFKVHILNGGVWKESHKTLYSNYSIGTGGQSETQSNTSWTVPDGTRYIRVKIWGNGAGGGGSLSSSTYRGTGMSSSFHSIGTASGGAGGSGGYAEVILETKPGVTFSWTGLGATASGGDGGSTMVSGQSNIQHDYNHYYTVGIGAWQGINFLGNNYRNDPGTVIQGTAAAPLETFGTYGYAKIPDQSYLNTIQIGSKASPNFWAKNGSDAPDVVFTGDSPTSGDPYVITALGGKKGYGGRDWVTASSSSGSGNSKQHYYTMAMGLSGTGGGRGEDWAHTQVSNYDVDEGSGSRDWTNPGNATASGNGSSFASSTLTRGGGSLGGVGATSTGADGSAGTSGKIIIDTYQ
tara:strand:- start:3108 stop:4241 length:1134 start_codon:yes stop_codon:yes gene_type:complete